MIERLRAIERGELEATNQDKAYLTHELREYELMDKGMSYGEAHAQTCKEYGITAEMERKTNGEHPFYTKEAEIADLKESGF
ncbi:hypothetical protein ETU08_09105 [Apibacter muscae]|uniref:hypothetical protein n=1 Tax=Apibacter muscae TaxID=2509004 RepID=UPI0011ADA65C|nr:hypothetical protein [Apibacter muscae]TWP28391.1 hypothetical protein ETU08_09105 [Apibacter muscae]